MELDDGFLNEIKKMNISGSVKGTSNAHFLKLNLKD